MIERKIGVTHMAFYRGWLQGLPLREMADLYLETGLDLRQAKSTLSWVQDMLRRAALRNGRHGEARLLRLRISETHTVTGQAAELPSIDDFREDADPTGFYSFDELMKLYLERYPQASSERGKRRAALLERQIRTLNWLEALLVTDPVPDDPVEAWLDPVFVKRLQKAGIYKLSDLISLITERGYRWYTTVPQLGEGRANKLQFWLNCYKSSLGALPERTGIKPANLKPSHKTRSPAVLSGAAENPLSPQIVPLEAMLLPMREPGARAGAGNRPPEEAHIRATNDREAIEEWLNAKSGSMATRRSYRKEAERLVLWSMIERGLTFTAMTPDDCAAYRDWLCSLGRVDETAWHFRIPQEQWMAPRHTKRYSPSWRPFEGALSSKSVSYALTVCNACFGWLVAVRYLDFNPWTVIAKPRADAGDAPDMELTRALSREQWDFLIASLDDIEDEAIRLRAHLILRLALVTGMRLSEIVSVTYGNIYTMALRDGSGSRWMLKVLGKGSKWRTVPLTDDVVRLMRQELRLQGLPDDPKSVRPDMRIVTRLDGQPLTSGGLAYVFKTIFALPYVRLVDQGKESEARIYSHASAHWVRHTTGSMLGDAGVPASQLQQLLGHESIATTTIYTSTSDEQLYKSVTKVL